ncbi:MAG: hypothetical protein QOH57_1822 [Mycobacterium sp.]|nr:hypothetical protein [Mycobacterium sp.]
MTSPDEVPTMACTVCAADVPAGAFCGYCGSRQAPRRGDGPPWLRLRSFGSAPNESVLLPSVASSLFPHLGHSSRRPFRVGIILLVVALVLFAVLRWQAPLVAVGTLGLPLLFLLYLHESGAYLHISPRALLLIAMVSIGFGVGWAWFTGAMIADSYDTAFGATMDSKQMLREGLVIPVAGALLGLVPTAVARWAGLGTREALDGFVIGALAATTFTAAATLTRLAPQFQTGLASELPISVLISGALIRGLVMSLITASAGGMVGAALWFTKPDPAHQHPGQVLARPLPALGVVVIAAAALGLIDASPASEGWELVVYIGVAVAMLICLRVVLHMALLREAHDSSTLEPILCDNCGHVVPDMAFCPACGVATQSSSRSSRSARRQNRPVRIDTTPEDE